MLELAAKLPPGALLGSDDASLSQALLATGGVRFLAREADLVRTEGRITGWRDSVLGVEARAAAPNGGNSRFDAGPPAGLICQEGVNCGFTLPGFAPEVEAFSVAVVYRSQGDARTLASVFTGQTNNMIFLGEGEGRVLVKERAGGLEVALPLPKREGARLVILSFDGRTLRLEADGQEAAVTGDVPGLVHQADFFIGCRSNRPGLAKTLGASRLQEVMFWPDRALLGSGEAEDRAALAALRRHFRWNC
ncbi:MAG TPA: hypothetical protein VK146_02925 [Tabrizicola sp.]|nr:hypothetical protein [Tabrizicola sp.]